MALHNFYAAYTEAQTLYGVDLPQNEFEDIAMLGWERIGNKHTRLYSYTGDVVDGKLELPCNVDVIESVHAPILDAQFTSNKSTMAATDSLWVESYIDLWKQNEDPYYSNGKYVKYTEGDGVLYFKKDYKHVKVVYHGILVDEENGLPLLSDKELQAIATFVAYIYLRKEAIAKRDGNLLQLAQTLNADWLRLCNNARIPEHFSQNDMDRILDVKVRWDRKQFGKGIAPII